MVDIHDIVWVTNKESKSFNRLARIKKIGFRGSVQIEGDKIFIYDGYRIATDTEERTFISQEKLSIIDKIKILLKWIRVR